MVNLYRKTFLARGRQGGILLPGYGVVYYLEGQFLSTVHPYQMERCYCGA